MSNIAIIAIALIIGIVLLVVGVPLGWAVGAVYVIAIVVALLL